MEKLEAFYGLPSEVKYCTRCVISNQRPNSIVEFKYRPGDRKPVIAFDEEGVCTACRYKEKKDRVDWAARERELARLCDRFRSKDGSYDCIVPGSGGKDSGYVSHMVKYKYGMNPLTVTWAPHKYTPIGWRNLQGWIDSGFDNVLVTPNGKLHRLLTRLAFENLCHPFQPFIIGQKMIASRFSALYGIPLVFYGENPVEYGDSTANPDSPIMDSSFFLREQDIDSLVLGGVPVPQLVREHGVDLRDLNPYLPPDPKRVREVGTQVHYFSYYFPWDPQTNFYYSVENTGYSPNTERTEGSYAKYQSIDDLVDYLHYYTTLIKFGIGRATYDAAQEIRNGKITREEGVALVRRYDTEFPAKHFQDLLEYMGITEPRFWEVINKARSPHLWKHEAGEWRLRHQVS